MNKYLKSVVLLLLLAFFISCHSGNTGKQVVGSEFLLGTTCVISIYDWERGAEPKKILAEAFQRISSLEQKLSVNLPESDVSRINTAPDKGIKPDGEVLDVLKNALDIAALSGGEFDPSVGRLVKLWGIGTEEAAIPSDTDLREALETIGYRDIKIRDDGSVLLNRAGMNLDLGGIAKGYAADRTADLLRERGVSSAIINLGGNVLTLGSKISGDPWRIGIQDPREPRGAYLGILKLENKAIVTSGIYERFFMEDGVRYHHILNTGTGYPVDNGVISTTIIHTDSVRADGLSTALFALGLEEGMKLAETLEGTSVIMVDQENRVYTTENLKKSFSLSPDSIYTLAEP